MLALSSSVDCAWVYTMLAQTYTPWSAMRSLLVPKAAAFCPWLKKCCRGVISRHNRWWAGVCLIGRKVFMHSFKANNLGFEVRYIHLNQSEKWQNPAPKPALGIFFSSIGRSNFVMLMYSARDFSYCTILKKMLMTCGRVECWIAPHTRPREMSIVQSGEKSKLSASNSTR